MAGAGVVVGSASLLLEDKEEEEEEEAAVSPAEAFCCRGAGTPSPLPLANWLRLPLAV